MKTPTEEQLKNALELSKEKTKLQKEVDKLLAQIEKIDIKIEEALRNESSEKATKAPKTAKGPESRRGKIKDLILDVLKTAGPEGMNLENLSKATGKDSKNLSVWFATTGTKIPGIVKVGRGTYAFNSTEPTEDAPASTTPEAPENSDAPTAPETSAPSEGEEETPEE